MLPASQRTWEQPPGSGNIMTCNLLLPDVRYHSCLDVHLQVVYEVGHALPQLPQLRPQPRRQPRPVCRRRSGVLKRLQGRPGPFQRQLNPPQPEQVLPHCAILAEHLHQAPGQGLTSVRMPRAKLSPAPRLGHPMGCKHMEGTLAACILYIVSRAVHGVKS